MTSEVNFDLRFEISDLQNLNDQSFKVPLLVSLGTCQEDEEVEICLFMTCASTAGKNMRALCLYVNQR